MNETSQSLVCLMGAAMGNPVAKGFPDVVDWEALLRLADRHHVAAVAYDGVQAMGLEMSKEERLKWIGCVMLTESRYRKYEGAVSRLAAFYRRHGIRMMVLKGYGLGMEWPQPSHRAMGDIDIFVWRESDEEMRCCQKEADALLESEMGVKVDFTHEHHSVFLFEGFTVENHYDFINVTDLRSSKPIEEHLKRLVSHGVREAHVSGMQIWLPPVEFNAAFLIRHLGRHFSGSEITLRQLLDWALFVRRYHDAIDWASLEQFCVETGLVDFARCANSICVRELCFNEEIFHSFLSSDDRLIGRIANDIMEPEFSPKVPKGRLPFAFYRLRRFFANGWKRRITYTESSLQAFFSIGMSHLRHGDF